MESLRPTLGPADEVIVALDGSSGYALPEQARFPWVKVVDTSEKPISADARNIAASVANREFLVFLNDDVLVRAGWLDELIAPFSDKSIGAVGPRSNGGDAGDQEVREISYLPGDVDSLGDFAQAWRRGHLGKMTWSARLQGFCLAIRAEEFRSFGGFDEGYLTASFRDDDLCMKLRNSGLRLVVAHGCYVHRTLGGKGIFAHGDELHDRHRFRSEWNADGIAPLVLLSVCLIVKDEEKMLQACLDSVSEVADEVVVYDTGSTDRTIDIARSAGARVIEGYWDDSFARARQAALERATGEWVLSLDADENLIADAASLRAQLADHRSQIEAYLIAIENLFGAGNGRSVHTAIRLFRRERCTWRHRLHEQVVAADDPNRALQAGYLSGVRIIHHGYVAEVFDSKGKAERNLALAKAALEDDEVVKPYALMNYGRALESAGRSDEAVEALFEAAEIADVPTTQRLALGNLIYALVRLRRFEEALEQVGELRQVSSSQIAADIAEGRVRIAMGDSEGGLAMLARVPPRGRDDDGMEYAAHMVAAVRGEALASLGRYGEAADMVLEAVRSDGVLEADLSELCLWLLKAGRDLSELADATGTKDLMPVLGRTLRLLPLLADAILEGIWVRFPDRLEPLAAAGRIGPKLPVARALVWSSRLRRAGLGSACPLVAIAKDEGADPRVRIFAAAAAFGSFGDRSIVNSLHEARSRLDPDAREESAKEIARLAPGLLEASHVDPAIAGQRSTLISAVGAERKDLPNPTRPKMAKMLKVSPMVQRGGVNIVAPFESTTVEGYVARAFASTLSSHGVSVSTYSYYADGRKGPVRWTHRDDGDLPFDKTLFVLAPEDLGNFVMDNGVAPFEGRYAIGVWPWDFDKPSESMFVVSSALHEVWTPSRFSAGAVAQATDRPVILIPLPVMTYWPIEKSRGVDGVPKFSFTFITGVDYITGFERQNPLGVVEAFSAAFSPGEGPGLLIEASHADRSVAEHRRLVESVANRPDIIVVDNFGRSAGRILGKTGCRSCYVSMHRSEGTGLMIARTMAQSIPTIVTAQGFSREFQGPQNSFQVPFVHVPVPKDELRCLPGGMWADPNLERAARAMKMVVNQPKLAAAKARQSKEKARLLSPGKVARTIKERLTAIDRARYGCQTNDRMNAVSVGARR